MVERKPYQLYGVFTPNTDLKCRGYKELSRREARLKRERIKQANKKTSRKLITAGLESKRR